MRLFGLDISRSARVTKGIGGLPVGRAESWFKVFGDAFPGAFQRNIEADSKERLLAFSAVYAASTMIASDVAKLRVKLVEWDAFDRVWSEIGSNSPFLPVLRKPNRYQTRVQFIESWMLSKLLHGNTFVLKQRDGRGMVEAMYVLDPKLVHPLVALDGSVYYELWQDTLTGIQTGTVRVPASEIIHDRMACLWHPLVGVSPIYACGASATQGIRIQHNSASFFENMSRPSGMLVAPGTITDESAERLKKEWESRFSGSNVGRLAVLSDGMKYEAMTIPAHDAQLIEQLRWTVEDVARAFRLPLHRLGAGPAPSLSNLESLEAQYYSNCLQVLIEALEQCLDEGLSLPSGYATELDLSGLLRMDTGSRVDALSKAVGGGWMAPNEARRREDLPPVEGGDTPYLQVQNSSLAALAKRDAQSPAPLAGAQPTKQLPTAEEYRREKNLLDAPPSVSEEEHTKLRDRVDRAESILKSIGLINQKLPERVAEVERMIPALRR